MLHRALLMMILLSLGLSYIALHLVRPLVNSLRLEQHIWTSFRADHEVFENRCFVTCTDTHTKAGGSREITNAHALNLFHYFSFGCVSAAAVVLPWSTTNTPERGVGGCNGAA